MKKKIVIALMILAVVIAAFVAVFAINLMDESTLTTVEIIETPAATVEAETTEAAEAADAAEVEAEVEAVAEVEELYGQITEITEECVMIKTAELGDVQVLLGEDTIIEGVETLELGQTAKVLYTGMMTRSLPPQITALLIGVYAVSGEVIAADEGSVTVTGENGEVILILPESAEVPAVGDVITAYTTGVSTMSIPPQMNAVAIEMVESVG